MPPAEVAKNLLRADRILTSILYDFFSGKEYTGKRMWFGGYTGHWLTRLGHKTGHCYLIEPKILPSKRHGILFFKIYKVAFSDKFFSEQTTLDQKNL